MVAMDCEMVGVGPNGTRSVLARVSIVDSEGKVLLDKHLFCKPGKLQNTPRSEAKQTTCREVLNSVASLCELY